MKYFSLDFEAIKIASLTRVSRQSINRILFALRERTVYLCEQESVFEKRSVEFDESYFGAKRVRGKRGRGATGKRIVFGFIKRGENIYTQVVSNCLVIEFIPLLFLRSILNQRFTQTALKPTTGWLILAIKNTFESYIETMSLRMVTITLYGIENFWGRAKMRLAKFRGISKKTFYLHLKECEFRFNHRNEVYKNTDFVE